MNLLDKISGHFTYEEVIRSKVAAAQGMNNNLPMELLPKIQLLAEKILEPVRAHFGKPIRITSWWRCPALNQMISNNPNSQHTKAEAVDFIIPGILNISIAEYIRDNLSFDELILEASWIHCSYIESNNRMEVLRSTSGKTYKKGLN